MLENLNDYITLFVLFLLVGFCIYIVFSVSNRHHSSASRKREQMYLSFLEGAQEDSDDSEIEDTYGN